MQIPRGFESRTVNVNNRPIYYLASVENSRDALPIVLVHGVGLSHRYLMPTAQLLAHSYRVYLPDLPGFGNSYKPGFLLDMHQLAGWVADWMKAIKLNQAAFLGNSVGCQVIVSLAVDHPFLVRCAVLQGLTVDPQARSFIQQFKHWRQNQKVEGGKKKGMSAYRDYWKCGIRRIIGTFGYAIEDKVEKNCPIYTAQH